MFSDSVDIARAAHQNGCDDVCTVAMNRKRFFHNNHIANSHRNAAKKGLAKNITFESFHLFLPVAIVNFQSKGLKIKRLATGNKNKLQTK